jgi:hypothetical protein
MANYIVRECTTTTTYIVSASTLMSGDVISFSSFETLICGVVIEETNAEHDSIYVATYSDCCSCLQDTGILSFMFTFCNGEAGNEVWIDLITFCEIYGGVPIVGETFTFFNIDTQEISCAEFLQINDASGVTFWQPDDGPFDNCSQCGNNIPKSANTESTVCVICCDCGATGSTTNIIVPPHPIWTDGYGNVVTQMNMITIGGNGLNS